MSQRATDLIGKPVVSSDTGEKLGTVSDLLLDDRGSQLLGLIVRHGMLRGEDVLPASAVQTLGRDAVVSRSRADLIPGREWKSRAAEYQPDSHRRELHGDSQLPAPPRTDRL